VPKVIFVNLDKGNSTTAQTDWQLDKDMVIVDFEGCKYFALWVQARVTSQLMPQHLPITLTFTLRLACKWAPPRFLNPN